MESQFLSPKEIFIYKTIQFKTKIRIKSENRCIGELQIFIKKTENTYAGKSMILVDFSFSFAIFADFDFGLFGLSEKKIA